MKTLRTLVLAGHYAGKDIVLYNVQFRKGRATLTETENNLEGLIRILGRCYQAYEEDSAILKAAQERDRKHQENPRGNLHPTKTSEQGNSHSVSSEVQPPSENGGSETASEGAGDDADRPGGSGLPADGDGQGSEDNSEPEADFTAVLIDVVNSLDPYNDNHWTELGEPKIEAVNAALPSHLKIDKRGTIESVAPGCTRESALAERRKNG